MDKEKATQILKDIQAECEQHRHCKDCKFYVVENFDRCCVLSLDQTPEDWEIDKLPNLKS